MTWFITPAQAQDHSAAPADPAAADAHGAAPADGAAHTEVAHEGGHEGTFPPFDPSTFASQLVWLAITFGLLYWMVSKTVAPRIGAILEVRRDRIGADLAEAERMRGETQAAIAAYEQSLAEAKARAGAIATETREKVARELDARRHAAEAELSARLAAAEAEISTIKAQAMGEVDAIATETTEAIVNALVGGASREEAAAAVAGARKG